MGQNLNEENKSKNKHVLQPHQLKSVDTSAGSSDDGEDDAKGQQSLEISSRSYKEFVHDNHMKSNDDYDVMTPAEALKANKQHVRDRLRKAKERASSAKERTDNVQVRERMRVRNAQNENTSNSNVYKRKAYSHIKKEDLQDDAYQDALDRAYETETLEDDKLVQRRMPKTLETIKYDDGVTEDDYLKAASKSARKYLD